MTIQQEAYRKIMQLPEDGVRLILVMADEIARQNRIYENTEMEAETRHRAFRNMQELREKSDYPKDFDYKKILGEALDEKYGFID